MLQTPEVAAARIQAWMRKHPSIAETDTNIAILAKYIRDFFSVSGETIIDEVYLDLAYRNIGSTMQHIVGPEVQAEIQQAQQQALEAQKKLNAANQAAKDERKRIEAENLRDQLQNNRRPGWASAMSGANEDAGLRARDAADAQKAAKRAILYQQFLTELRDINIYLVTDSQGHIRHGATGDYKKAAKENLKRKYPQFASEVVA